MRLAISKEGMRALCRMDGRTAKRVRQKIRQYTEDPASLANNVSKLRNQEGYRLRVGDYRVIFSSDGTPPLLLDATVMEVLDIVTREDAYRH